MTSALMLLLPLVEQGPDDEDVVAGWTAFGLFGLLILAVVVLGFSLTKHLKRAERSEAEGRYDPPTRRPAPPQA
jgi:hypothetical protein